MLRIVVVIAAFAIAKNRASHISVSTSNLRDDYAHGELMFDENFDGPTLDLSKWSHDKNMNGGGNGEFQIYTDSPKNTLFNNIIAPNGSVVGSAIYLNPTLVNETYGNSFLYSGTIDLTTEGCTDPTVNEVPWVCTQTGNPSLPVPPVYSSKITTKGKFAFTYGRVEVMAKLPRGDWLWPAIWLLPECNYYGEWPQSGEIDIMESRGNAWLRDPVTGTDIGTKQFGTTLHFGTRCGPWCGADDAWETAHMRVNCFKGFDGAYHNYTMLWTPDGFEFLIDSEPYPYNNKITPDPTEGFWKMVRERFSWKSQTNIWKRSDINKNFKMAPFDQKFYIICNLAVGGTNGYFYRTFTGLPFKDEKREDVWPTDDQFAKKDFWENAPKWLPTWKEDDKALKIDYIKVYAL